MPDAERSPGDGQNVDRPEPTHHKASELIQDYDPGQPATLSFVCVHPAETAFACERLRSTRTISCAVADCSRSNRARR